MPGTKSLAINAIAIQSERPIGVERFVKLVVGSSRFDCARLLLCLRHGVSAKAAFGEKFLINHQDLVLRRYLANRTWTRILIEMIRLSWDLRHYDTVLSINNFGPLFGKSHQRRIIIIHDVWFLSAEYDGSAFLKWVFQFLLRLQVSRSDEILTVSAFSRREIARHLGVDESGIIVVENCIPPPVSDDEFTAFYPLDSPAYFCLIGSDRRNKNIHRALLAYRDYCTSTRDPVRLRIFGDFSGQFVENASREFSDLQALITFEGYVGRGRFELALANSRGVVFPSLYEGFGIPVIEALQARKPVMVSRDTACADMAGKTAVIVDGTSIGALAEGYSQLEQFKVESVVDIMESITRKCSDCEGRARELQNAVLPEVSEREEFA